MPVCAHGNKVAMPPPGRRRHSPRRLPPRQDRVGVEAFRLQPAAEVFEIRAVLLDLLRLPQVELVDVARHPPVRHVDEDERGAELLRQLPHVRQDGLVRGGVFERHEDPRIHQTLPRKIWTRSQALNPAIAHATTQASSLSHAGFTNSPIFARSEVNRTSGKTAKDSCRLRITWLRMSSLAVPVSPKKIAVHRAGTIAISRMLRHRSQRRIRMFRHP